jgi:predicted lactoylglutathione lyase
MNPFNHIDLRVSDLGAAYAFYSRLLPAAGFPHEDSGDTWKLFAGDGRFPHKAFFAVTEEAGHRPNSNRIALAAASREEVDRLAGVVREAGGRNISGPRECPEYSPTYYAVFFEDPCGNKLEVCYQSD